MSLESGLTQATTHTPLWARRRIRLRFAAAFATGPTRQRHNLHGQHGLDEFALRQRAIHEWLEPVGCNGSDVNMRRCSMNLAVAALGTLILATTPALSAGFEQVIVGGLSRARSHFLPWTRT
jgi:hypothetical protein